jgi:uncharacterized membrane protein YphA (DoxX/SURF4 family)
MRQLIERIEAFLSRHSRLAPLFLRIGLATVLTYAAISSLINPNDWIGYVPIFIRDFIPATTVLAIFSVIQLGVAVWLLSGKHVRIAALVCAGMLAGIVVSNFSLLPISFRDIGLLFAALALTVMKDE